MAHLTRFGGMTALLTVASVSPAFADLTAQEVWSDWRSYLGGLGYDISATEASAGGDLTLSDLTMRMALPEEAGSMEVVFGEMTFSEAGDGTVAITMPTTMPMTVFARPEGEEEVEARIDLTHEGFEMVVSGAADDLSYTYSADTMSMVLASLIVEGQPLGNAVSYNMVIDGLDGTSATKMGAMRDLSQTVKATRVSYEMTAVDPEGSGNMVFKGSVNGLSFDGSGSLPKDMNVVDPADIFKSGFAARGSFSHSGGSTEFSFVEDGQPVQFSSRSTGGTLDMDMGASKISYTGASRGLEINAAGGDLPLPVQAAAGEMGFSMLVPLEQAESAQDFGMAVRIIDLTVADMLWSIFDPQSVLPRDPATLIIDLAGTGVLMADLMDPETMNAPAPPMMPNSIDLKELDLSIAGARLTGAGAFSFDPSDMTMFDGMPRPEGAVDLQLVGGNGLLDKLVQMGLLPEDQAMSARMMMGLFAVPGNAPDTLNSKIEVNSQGHVLANGQRIQ